jgi:NAD+ kinase
MKNTKEIGVLPVIGKQPGARECWDALQACGMRENYDNPKAITVYAGDGGFLGAQRDYYKLGVPFVGFGFGRKNFLLNWNLCTPKELYKKFLRDDWIRFEMQGLRVYMDTDDGVLNGIAFNDVFIKNIDPTGVIHAKLITAEYPGKSVDGDGLIIATPQGSTAYNRNAGGTILPLSSNLWAVTGICTDQRLHATVNQQEVIIEVAHGEVVVVTDNQPFYGVLRIRIVPSKYSTTILFDPDENFEQRRYNE